MRIGTFLLILLVATVALGYLLSDNIHLREDLAHQRQENQRLVQALQQTAQEKQNLLTTILVTSQELDSCHQVVEQSKSIIVQLTDQNSSLKNYNEQLESALQSLNTQSSSVKISPKTIDATIVSLASFVTVSLVSAMIFGFKYLQRWIFFKGRSTTGQYVFLSNTEVADLVKRRRSTRQSNSPS